MCCGTSFFYALLKSLALCRVLFLEGLCRFSEGSQFKPQALAIAVVSPRIFCSLRLCRIDGYVLYAGCFIVWLKP